MSSRGSFNGGVINQFAFGAGTFVQEMTADVVATVSHAVRINGRLAIHPAAGIAVETAADLKRLAVLSAATKIEHTGGCVLTRRPVMIGHLSVSGDLFASLTRRPIMRAADEISIRVSANIAWRYFRPTRRIRTLHVAPRRWISVPRDDRSAQVAAERRTIVVPRDREVIS